jgi:hypothetical protein
MKRAYPWLRFRFKNEPIPFLGVAGNGDAADGKFDAQLRFDRGFDDGVIAEVLFDLVGIGGLAAHADAGVSIIRELGTEGFFLGKRIGVGSVDGGIDFLELCDYIVHREPGEINHLKAPRAFGEIVRPSKMISGSLFLFSCQNLHSAPSTDSFFIYSTVFSSSRSMKIGDAAVRSCSRA